MSEQQYDWSAELTAAGITPAQNPTSLRQAIGQILAAQGGSSVPGASIVRAFPFAFDTPNLLTGAALYTPTVGDVLLDAWFSITTAWDGTTPLGDFGKFSGASTGFWHGFAGLCVPMANADTTVVPLGTSVGESLNDAVLTASLWNPTSDQGNGLYAVAGAAVNTSGASFISNGSRYLPSTFISADPIKVVVSQTGASNGADPGSTQGAAILYLVTATPA